MTAIKHIRFGRRRHDVRHDEFQEAWFRHHVMTMAKRTQALRYQRVSFFPDAAGADPAFHHAVALWYRDREHWQQAYGGGPPDPDPTLAMADRSGGLLLVATEHVLVDGPESLATSTWYLRPRVPGGAADGSLPREWAREREVMDRLPGSTPIRVVTSVVNDPTDGQSHVALTEVHWVSTSARLAGEAAPELQDLFAGATKLAPSLPVTVIPRTTA
jgi:hypothetical protein